MGIIAYPKCKLKKVIQHESREETLLIMRVCIHSPQLALETITGEWEKGNSAYFDGTESQFKYRTDKFPETSYIQSSL